MECIIVDISKPPSSKLSPFSVYVTLSRSRGWDTIRILRDFNPELLMHHPSEDLRVEIARLEHLNERTKAVSSEIGKLYYLVGVTNIEELIKK